MFNYLSFSTKSSFLSALSLGAFFIFAISLYEKTAHEVEEDIVKSQLYSTQILSESLSAQFFERYGDVQAFAANPIFIQEDSTPMVEVLNRYVALYGIYDLIMVLDKEGRVKAVNSLDQYGKEIPGHKKIYDTVVSNEPWFISTIQQKFTTEKDKSFDGSFVGDFSKDPFISLAYGKMTWGTSFSTPIKNSNGETVGVLSNRSNSKWMESELQNLFLFLKKRGLEKTKISLLNKNGLLMTELFLDENKKVNFLFDDRINLKKNFFKMNWASLNDLEKGEKKSEFSLNPETQENVLLSYSSILSQKFISKLGWKIVIQSSAKNALNLIQTQRKQFIFYLFLCGCFLVLGTYLFSTFLSKKLVNISKDMDQTVSQTIQMSEQMSHAATGLLDASSSQASSIEQSVSALSEITSLMARTSKNVKISLETAELMEEKTEEGQKVMNNLSQAMNSIYDSSEHLQEITKIIEDIQSKTLMINEIVFKTQLLSFNASIEAARAGQNGRGFAVVAEEVGNLAFRSGKVANEVDILLNVSFEKVNASIEKIKNRIQYGHKINKEAGASFSEIAQKIKDVKDQVESIDQASQQQDAGIQQTKEALVHLTSGAEKTKLSSERVRSNSNLLNEISQNLVYSKNKVFMFAHGESKKKSAS